MIKECLENILSIFMSINQPVIEVPETPEKQEVPGVPILIEKEMTKPTIVQMPLPNFNVGWPKPADIAIIHYSAGYSVEGCFNTLLSRRLSVHESVERDGVIYQHLDHKNRGIHAGHGRWGGRSNMNGRSFGVEVINFGWGYEGDGSPSENRKFGPTSDELAQDPNGVWNRTEGHTRDGEKVFTRVLTKQKMSTFADHRDEHSDKMWAEYTDKQVASTNWLVWQWMKENPEIILENVIGHEHVSPHRKTDPGPAWPWRKTEEFLEKMASKERPELLDPAYKLEQRVLAVQSHVHRCGIEIGLVDGDWGTKTMKGVSKLIETYNEIYNLELSVADIRIEKCLKLANAFRLIPGFDSGNR